MSAHYRCDAPGCEKVAEGWAGEQAMPPPGWFAVEVLHGTRGPERVVDHVLHGCSPHHIVAALSSAGFRP